VDAQGFVLLLTVAAVVLAVWFDLRFQSRRPESVVWRLVHAAVAFVVLELTAAGVASVLRGQAPVGEQTLVLLLAYLPSMIYTFLTGIWLVRTMVEIAGLVRR
jgi:hypothetical protein